MVEVADEGIVWAAAQDSGSRPKEDRAEGTEARKGAVRGAVAKAEMQWEQWQRHSTRR